MKSFLAIISAAVIVSTALNICQAFSLSMISENNPSRRDLMKTTASSFAAVIGGSVTSQTFVAPASAASPSIYTLDSGIKYAVTKDSEKGYPQQGDLVVVEYTGYLSNGVIFDATHSEGKSNALLFKLGSTAVIPGINQMVSEMRVGQKVQAIIPPQLAFGDKGICLESGECLVKPGSTLVYDISLKKSTIPPP